MDKDFDSDIIVNEFTEKSANKFREELLRKVKDSEDDDCPIIVYIDSYGGYVDSLAAMVETMQTVPNPIVTVALGKASSCGAIMLSFGDVRFCGPHSRIMIHEISAGAIGDVHDVNNTAEEVAKQNAYWMGKLAENCKIKGGFKGLRKIIKERDGRDIFLDPEGALKFGIVEAIGMPKIHKQITYEILELKPKQHKFKVKG